jgi:hypothetical protein
MIDIHNTWRAALGLFLQVVRRDLWGYAPDESLNVDDLLKVKYQVREAELEGWCVRNSV